MQRCLELAAKGAGSVAPNPLVGAVLVYEDRIIGEGYHQRYGEAHAEVNCINSVRASDRYLVASSTLYVSLEPCAHFGKTPPCSDLIIRERIPKVVVGCRDPFPEVDGKGIEKLKRAGVTVQTGLLETACRQLNKRFFCWVQQQRPYVILKWAQTADGYMAGNTTGRLLISNEYSNRLVHQWRSEEAAILVGTETALLDDPALTNRLWKGPSPVRMVLDRNLRLPSSLQLFDGTVKTVVLNAQKESEEGSLMYYRIDSSVEVVSQILLAACQLHLQSILVEGGRALLQSFIDTGLWDEVRVITNGELVVGDGLPVPVLTNGYTEKKQAYGSDTIHYYLPDTTPASSHPSISA